MRLAIRKTLPPVMAGAMLMTVAGDVAAHARLKRAIPSVGGVVAAAQAPKELQVWFTEAVEPKLSSLQVIGPDGARVDQGDVRIDADDRTQLRVTLFPLKPNLYRVVWRVVSVDSHRTNGSFPFRVEP